MLDPRISYSALFRSSTSDALEVAALSPRVVIATCQLCAKLTDSNRPDLIVIDEAGQATEPQSLVPLARFPKARVVLAGDHKQLSPLLLDREAALLGLDRSLLERLVQERLEIEEQQAKIREAGTGGSGKKNVAGEALGEAEAAGGLGSAAPDPIGRSSSDRASNADGGDSALLALSEEDKYILSLNATTHFLKRSYRGHPDLTQLWNIFYSRQLVADGNRTETAMKFRATGKPAVFHDLSLEKVGAEDKIKSECQSPGPSPTRDHGKVVCAHADLCACGKGYTAFSRRGCACHDSLDDRGRVVMELIDKTNLPALVEEVYS